MWLSAKVLCTQRPLLAKYLGHRAFIVAHKTTSTSQHSSVAIEHTLHQNAHCRCHRPHLPGASSVPYPKSPCNITVTAFVTESMRGCQSFARQQHMITQQSKRYSCPGRSPSKDHFAGHKRKRKRIRRWRAHQLLFHKPFIYSGNL